MKVVYIKWVDSGGNDVMWEFKDSKEIKLLECDSVGFLVRENKESITIAQSDSPNQWGRQFCIPKGCIIKKRYIKL